MTTSASLPQPEGLTSEQLETLRALAESLSPGQSVLAVRWLLSRLDESALLEDRLESAESSEGAAACLTILYGSHSGHSASIAKALANRAKEKGWSVTLANMADYSRGSLKHEKNLAIVVSTHGEGDPPESILPFYEFLRGARAPKLVDCGFAVLALGDRSYKHFCQTGIDFDRRLEELGAKRLLDRIDLDVDYQDGADTWSASAVDTFAPRMQAAPAVVRKSSPRQIRRFDRENPFTAEVLETVVLSGRGSTQHYGHLELSLEGSRIKYEPGDALGVRPKNDPALVGGIIEALKQPADALVRVGGEEYTLSVALTDKLELAHVKPSSLRKYATHGAGDLGEITANEGLTLAYVEGRDWLDVLREHPTEIGLAEFVALLPELGSRSYSIASCLEAHPDEVHLLVSRLSYSAHGRTRSGVASGYLADRVQAGDRLEVWVESNSNFRLPADPSLPIIMIGAGTGVAPYRAFMEARGSAGAKGKNWVLFGNRSFRSDFTYQVDWLKWRDQGLLTRMDVAFSRDQANKVYVTDKLREVGAELYSWLSQGARIYLCGDRAKLSSAIDQALADVLMRHGGKTADQAAVYVEQLQAEHRYVKDVY